MKKQFAICVAVYILLACAPVKGQAIDTTLKGKYERETILLDGNKDRYSKNNESQKVGAFGATLAKEFETTSPESKEALKTFRKQRRRGAALLIAGSTVFLGAAFVAPVIAFPVFLSVFGSGVVSYYIGAFELKHSQKHLNKAVWLHNRDLLVKQ